MKKLIVIWACLILVVPCSAAITTDAVISVTESEIGGSGDCPIRLNPDGSLVQEQEWGSNNTGLHNFFSTLPRPLFPSYFETGFSWEMSGGSIDWVPVTITANVVSTYEMVSTPAGNFDYCIKIAYSYTYDYDPGTGHQFIQNITRYFKEGVGIVKLIVERPTQIETSILISYSVSGGRGIVPLKVGNEWTYEWDRYWWWAEGNTETFKTTEVVESNSIALAGKVIDAKTAEPLAGIEVTYSNNSNDVWENTFTRMDGSFILANLAPGIGEIKARPSVNTGYAWSLPWGSNWVCLGEGEHRSNRIIALQKGTLVTGYIKDVNGIPISRAEYDWNGRTCEGWGRADVNGHYQIRLPVGSYVITLDEENFCELPAKVTITDINQPVEVNDMIAYSEQTGGQISGVVNNPGGDPIAGDLLVVAFEAGTIIDVNSWYTIEPLRTAELSVAGPFAITALPPDANYDVYLVEEIETLDGIESISGLDSVFNIPVGTTGINLDYNSEWSTVSGKVINTNGQAVLGGTVLLNDPCTAAFAGFGRTDPNGEYVIYNVPAGTYNVAAVHSKYLNASITVKVVDGVPTDVDTIVMSFSGEKEGANLTGDGIVNMVDYAKFANQWSQSGSLEANFNQDGSVDFIDLTRVAENWLWQAIWYHD